MSVFQFATIAVFASLGLLAVAIAMLARRSTRVALAMGLVGLFTATAGSAGLVRAWPREAPNGTVERLRTQIEAALAGKKAAEERNAEAARRIYGLTSELDGLRAQKADFQERLQNFEGTVGPAGPAPATNGSTETSEPRLRHEILRLQQELTTARNDADDAERRAEADAAEWRRRAEEAERAHPSASAEAAAARKRLEGALEQEQRRLEDAEKARAELAEKLEQQQKATTKAEGAMRAAKARVAQLEKERDHLHGKLQERGNAGGTEVSFGSTVRAPPFDAKETAHYSLAPLPQRELVHGRSGRWYRLRLKLEGRPLTFADRSFRLEGADAALRESMEQLEKDVLRPLADAKAEFTFFVRGSADGRRIAGPTETPEGADLQVLPQGSDGRYDDTPSRRVIAGTLRNEDLPRLRADWLRSRIARHLPAGNRRLPILENPPRRGEGRTAELLLFVAEPRP